MKYLWNPEHAFAFPALATGKYGDVGISFCWGGNRWYPQHGVGMLTRLGHPLTHPSLVSTSTGRTKGAGGDYISIRTDFPSGQLCASGFNMMITTWTPPYDGNEASLGLVCHPHYVVFHN
jgi:hypothetical protein